MTNDKLGISLSVVSCKLFSFSGYQRFSYNFKILTSVVAMTSIEHTYDLRYASGNEA